MIDALFNQNGYLAAKKMLDATTVRQDAIASNLANLKTPAAWPCNRCKSANADAPATPPR